MAAKVRSKDARASHAPFLFAHACNCNSHCSDRTNITKSDSSKLFLKRLGRLSGRFREIPGRFQPHPWPPGLGGHDIYRPYHKNTPESYVINDVVHTHSILLLWTCTLMYNIKSCCIHNLAGNPELVTQVSTNLKSSHLSASAVSIP